MARARELVVVWAQEELVRQVALRAAELPGEVRAKKWLNEYAQLEFFWLLRLAGDVAAARHVLSRLTEAKCCLAYWQVLSQLRRHLPAG